MSILSSLLNLGQGQPTSQVPQVVQTTEIAKEVAPFIKDILGKGQALYKQRMDEGYVPYEGKTLAEMTADQLAAEQGLRDLVGSQTADFAEARELTRAQTDAPTLANLQPFMNPYQQAVTDIAKREAQERFEQTTLPTLRKRAVDAGSFGGSRAAMLESQAQDAQARLLADLQAKGDLAAFQNAQKAFADQKERERLAAQGLTSLSGLEDAATRKELAGLQAVGVTQQKREQQLLDEAYKKFLDERRFPEQQLGQYQAFTAGASPFLKTASTTMTPQTYQDSPIEKALKFGTTAIGTGLEAKKLFSKEGGGIEQGLASLPVVQRADAGIIMDSAAQRRRPPMIEDEEIDEIDMSNLSKKEKLAILKEQADKKRRGFNPTEARSPEIVVGSPLSKAVVENLDDDTLQAIKENAIKSATMINKVPTGEALEQVMEEIKNRPALNDERINPLDDERIRRIFISKDNKSQPVDIDSAETETDSGGTDSGGTDSGGTSDDSIKIPSEQDALKLQATNISNFQKAIDERKDARLANIKASKAALKAQAQIDFLMGFSKGKRDPRDGSFLGGLTAMGQSAVDATKDFNKEIMALDREELAVLDKNVKDQFDLETQTINLAFKKGELSRAERDYLLEEKKVNFLGITAGIDRAKDSATFAMSIVNNDKLTPGQKRQFLDDALANNVISLQDYRNALTDPDALKKNTGDDPIDLNTKVPITVNP